MIENKDLLKKHFGISYLRPYQELAVSHILECSGREERGRVLCSLPTGSGKSLCFMYPILLMRKRALLIYPLLSLMNDQAKRFKEAGIPCFVLKGGMSKEEKEKCLSGIRENREAAVITNPEMLLAMDRRNELKEIGKTELVVIDEAHTAVTWGRNFRESYLSLPYLIERINPSSVLAFTATMDREIEEGIISVIFSGEKPRIIRQSTDRENIFYHSVCSLGKIHDAVKILTPPEARPAVIFCRSRAKAEETAKLLSHRFPVHYYHAGLERDEKLMLEKWFYSSQDGVLTATSAYGMGVDKKDIRTVIHLSMPSSAADFLQESGRGGRDGKRADSYVLRSADEKSGLSGIFSGGCCIRTSLLREMGEETETDGCLSCSACVSDGYVRAGEKEILSYITRHPFISKKSAAAGLSQKNIFHKRLGEWTETEILDALDTLTKEDMIRTLFGRYMIIRRQRKQRTVSNSIT